MNYVSITHNDQVYYLIKQPNNTWLFSDRETLYDQTPIEITFTDDNGNYIINTDDVALANAISVLLTEGYSFRGEQMINYYPEVVKVLTEYQALTQSVGFEIDFLKCEIELALNDAFITTMGEERIEQWEKFLGIQPLDDSSLTDRRDAIIGRFRGGYKLNTASINSIVSAFTNGTADCRFEDGVIHVAITPPKDNKQYRFENVENELKRRVPAHLSISVYRDYATWGEVITRYDSWDDIKNSFATWGDLQQYVVPKT